MKKITMFFASVIMSGLTACGGGGGAGGDSDPTPTPGNSDKNPAANVSCAASERAVQWEALLAGNATYLSEYQLFSNSCDPTSGPSDRGLAYDLSVPLFTDYATKYRFVFIPENTQAAYSSGADTTLEDGRILYADDGVIDFPIGTVIVKTFSLPSDTSDRGFDKENMVETRLLIHRATGWKALPYVWNAAKTDAQLDFNGDSQQASIMHGSEQLNFTYNVPDPQKCQRCHQVEGKTKPIGPKARYLNMDYTYADGTTKNQLTQWVDKGILEETSLPRIVEAVPVFKDSTVLNDIAPENLEQAAKAWLDINCAHCHNPAGDASNTRMHIEYTRSYTFDKSGHGVCQDPVSGAGSGFANIIVPGDASNSLLTYRLGTRNAGELMPPLGRDLVHTEGHALVSRWINSLNPGDGTCGQQQP
jgi:uncharacterized repeat protein (TIGR03806 family)